MSDETAGTHRAQADAVARNVRARRRACGFSITELADLAGVSETWIRALEEGRTAANRASLTRLAAPLGTSVGRLASTKDDAYEPAPAPRSSEPVPSVPVGPHAPGMIAMEREECYARLAMKSVGRVSPGSAAEPFVLPVNYMLDGQDIVFRTEPGSSPAGVERLVAFEVDDLLPSARLGWSVLVVGEARRVTEEADLRRLEAGDLTPWPKGEHHVWMRIRTQRVTGRRITPHR